MIILLLSGWAGAGKDATASILSTYGYKRYAFADALKKQVAEEYQFPLEWCYTQRGKLLKPDTAKANGKTVRELLIQRGQEIRAEKNNPGYFAEKTAQQILQDFPPLVVITDWRLPCEYETMKEYFFLSGKLVLVRIDRHGQEKSLVNDTLTEHSLDHLKFDIVVENPGTSWEGLHTEIKKKLSPYLGKCIDNSPV